MVDAIRLGAVVKGLSIAFINGPLPETTAV